MNFDIPHLMLQAGVNHFAPQTGAHPVQPGPVTHDGLFCDPQEPSEGKATLSAINAMLDDIRGWDAGRTEPLVDELRRTWNEDMVCGGLRESAQPAPFRALPNNIPARFATRSEHGDSAGIWP